MTDVLDFHKQRRHLIAKRAFHAWSCLFPETFDENTSLKDLSDTTLAALIAGSDESSMVLYEFIMGVRGMGRGPRFYFLEPDAKIQIMDITLFLLDRLRFEAMRRLGWVEEDLGFDVPLLDLIELFQDRFSAVRHSTPLLSKAHGGYLEYTKLCEGDKSAFVRRLIPEALEEFRQRMQGESNP